MLAPLLLLPLLMRPVVGLLAAAVVFAVVLAWHSPAYPLALASLPPVLFAIFGPNPLPEGGITALLAAWVAMGIALTILKPASRAPLAVVLSIPTIATIALVGWMLFRLPGSAAGGYGQEKLQLFLIGNVTFLIGGIFVGWRPRDVKLLLLLVLAVSFAGACVLTVELLSGNADTILPDRLSISPEDDPISLGRESASGLLIAVYLLLSVKSSAGRLALLVAVPVLAVALISAGSRGPVAGVLVGLVVFAALAVTTRTARRRLLLVGAAGLACVLAVPLLVPDAAISRSLEIFSVSGGGLSSNGRTALWGQAVEAFANSPFLGLGTGGFAGAQVAEQYPHNLLLEVAAELGVIGLVLVCALLVNASARMAKAWRAGDGDQRLMVAVVAALFTTGLVNALFSAGIQDNRAVWLWAGVGVGLSANVLGMARTPATRPELALRARPAW